MTDAMIQILNCQRKSLLEFIAAAARIPLRRKS